MCQQSSTVRTRLGDAPQAAEHLVGLVGDDHVDAEVADEVHVLGAC